MGLIGFVQECFRGAEASDLLVECRRCGTALDSDDDACPACGSQEVARFRL